MDVKTVPSPNGDPHVLPTFSASILLLSFLSLLWHQKTDNDIFKALAVSSLIFAIIWGLVLVHWSNSPAGTAVIVKIQNPRFQFGARA
ncbi:MAG UNVERIFIED_CONTAM: hypothetical protein LVR29_31665 [Microcystis novacekii LVE1205-3]|jgi:hypothetical protein